jgi:hypothetical protein
VERCRTPLGAADHAQAAEAAVAGDNLQEYRTPFSVRVPPLEYPAHFETHYVSANGGIRWNRRWVNVSVTCIGEYVGLEEVDDGIWAVSIRPLKLRRPLEKHLRIEHAHGRLRRHRVFLSPDNS